MLRRLEAAGSVVRADDREDRRENTTDLTETGKQTLDGMEALAVTAQTQLLEPLSEQQREELIGLLEILVEHHRDYRRPDTRGDSTPT